MHITRFEYLPDTKTVVKYKQGIEVSRLDLEDQELESLYFMLWTCIQDKRFAVELFESETIQTTETTERN